MKQNKSRRNFIELSIKAGIAIPLLSSSLLSCNTKPASKKLNILILGGTSFLGPQQIAYALDRGHSITTFTRGKTKPTVHADLFDKVEQLIGDRENDLTALQNRKWDAVIDNSGHNVEWTKNSANLLKDNVDLYLYTSSVSAYYPFIKDNINEDQELRLNEPEGIEDEELKMEYWYSVMKANSEIAAKSIFGKDRTIVVRPTYIIGPGDKSNRFIYWPIRLSKGGDTLVPGKAGDPVQYIDVRDVAEWTIRLIEDKNTDTFNAVGPYQAQNMHGFLEEAKTAFNVKTNLIQVDDYDFLKKHNIHYIVPWVLPEGNNLGGAAISNKKGVENGLTYRPLKDTVKDTHDWWYSDALTQEKRDEYELKPNSILLREKDILADWKNLK